MKIKDGKIRLSPSTLNLYLECPKCFWLEQKAGIHRPRSPFPSLPGGMDLLIKKYFDRFRLEDKLPPEIDGKVEGKLLADLELMNKWRNWRTGLSYEDKTTGAVLIGALDDCLTLNGQFIPLDYKTRGFDLKEDSQKYYRNQLNCYSFLLETNGLKQPSFAYLIYYIPKEVNSGGMVRFDIEPVKVETYSQTALKVFNEAVKLLTEGSAPLSHSECQFCAWGNDFIE